MKRYLIPLAVAIGLTVSAPASAHHEHEVTITGEATCAAPSGEYTATWTIRSIPDDDGLDWVIGGVRQPDSDPFVITVDYDRDDGPGAEFEALIIWKDGDRKVEYIGRSGKIPAGEPCGVDSVPPTDAPTTVAPTTVPVTIGEINGPAQVGTSTVPTTSIVSENPISSTPTPTPLPAPTLPRTGVSTADVLLAAAGVAVGGVLVLIFSRLRRS